jgi:serine/threonine-protein kinase HipA
MCWLLSVLTEIIGKRIHSLSTGTALRAATPLGQEPQMRYPALARLILQDSQELFRLMAF